MTYNQRTNLEQPSLAGVETLFSHGVFVISLDFELYWGMRDSKKLDDYLPNLLGVHEAIPATIELFSAYGIHATWAVVGLIACANREEALACIPHDEPQYRHEWLSPYTYLSSPAFVENDEIHFAPSLIQQLVDADYQEVATHTFCHYYCLEDGQTTNTFNQDLVAAIELFQHKFGIRPKSIVFPRNQYSEEHIKICSGLGLLAYRGSSRGWWNTPIRKDQENLARRLFRLTDSYFNMSGFNSSAGFPEQTLGLINIPASRLLRPCPTNTVIRQLQVRRIKAEMLYAAQHKCVYHLWWHPHNFGGDIDRNLNLLQDILEYFSYLNSSFGMKSMNMQESALAILKKGTIN